MELVKQPQAQVTETAQQLPSTLLDLATNGQPHGRDSGLLVTRDDIFKIKSYERLGLSLPVSLEQVQAMIGTGKTGVPGLEAEDLLALNKDIYLHAVTWSDIEQQVKLTNNRLSTFATDFVSIGDRLVNYIDSMDWIDPFETKVRQLKLADISGLTTSFLSAADLKRKNNLKKILDRIQHLVVEQQVVVSKVRSEISRFADGLNHQLIPAVNFKLNLARSHGLAGAIKVLDEEIKGLAEDIKLKREEYEQLVTLILAGFIFGPGGAIIMGGIFGPDAERVRKERNALIELREQKNEQIENKAPVIRAIGSLIRHLEYVELTLSDALTGVQNLRSMWDAMHAWIENARGKLALVNDGLSMAEFALEFELVLQPWKKIKEQSSQLAVTFNRAINDWNSGVKA